MIAAMDSNKIEDPEVKKMIELFKNKEETFLKEYNKNFRLANVLGMGNKFKRHTYEGYWQRKGTPLTSAYPLANAFDTYNRRDKSNKHVYFYMNALYRARKDGKSV
jgi:hypothetical protein